MTTENRGARIERLTVVLAGAPPTPLVRRLMQRLSRMVTVPCHLDADRFRLPVPILEGRNQGDADRLLEAIEALPAAAGEVVVGLTPTDIGHPVFTHFFGRARRDGHALVVSLARLAPDFYGLPRDDDLLVHRASLEILHELGHVAGLSHCDDHGCIMRFSPTAEGIDTRGTWFCSRCEEPFLERLTATPPTRTRRATDLS